ncbi:MAG: DUF4294 domain-containing protein [Flavobacteriales bacterium]|nr:DUF4294 domain-containing protein [Flavobacteriales bacterium]
MRIYLLYIFLILILSNSLKSQNNINYEVINNDTIFFSDIKEVKIIEFKTINDKRAYYNLRRKVLKVYPYSQIAKEKLYDISVALDSIPKKRKKQKYTKRITKWIKSEYADRLKKLTKSEGKILVKLIYRETQISSYDIIRSYRGRFNAFFWQSMAKFWDNNLKTEYDPLINSEDMLIEHIINDAILKENISNN